MKCFNCQKEILDHSLYCSFCGKPTSIVPDYSVYEDDNIHVILEGAETVRAKEEALKEEQRKIAGQKKLAAEQKKEEIKKAKLIEKKKRKRTQMTIIIVACVCVLLVVLGIFVKVAIDKYNANSVSYQVKLAEEAEKNKDYKAAVSYYKKAIQIDTDNVSVRMSLVDLYFYMDEKEKAVQLLHETVEQDKTAYDAYKELLSYYEKQNDIDSIMNLLDEVTDDRVKTLFKNYIVDKPKIHLTGGTYTETIRITVSGKMGDSIYYTIDNSDPLKNGTLYNGPIILDKKGTYTLKAVAINNRGVYSKVISQTYTLDVNLPGDPVIILTETNEIIEGGIFTEETYISIHVPTGCQAYFTWDKTDPTKETGTLYEESILVPEGDNILSVIIIDENNDQESIIFRGRFEYYPGAVNKETNRPETE